VSFQVLMSMQMDACLKKEQIGTLFVRVGALEGGVGGGGASGVSTPKSNRVVPQKNHPPEPRVNFGPPARNDHPPPRAPFLTPHTNKKGVILLSLKAAFCLHISHANKVIPDKL